jgi:hypothetical protein
MAHHKMPAHKAIGTARKFQIDQFPDGGLLEGGILDRLVHQAKSGFIFGTRFNRKAHAVVCDAIAQFAILEKARRPKTHRERIAPRLYRDDFAGRLNNSRKHTGTNLEIFPVAIRDFTPKSIKNRLSRTVQNADTFW